ncbi:MAG: hypothetical protein IRY99_03685 [Isosphaeraceae bacterium]|nr:hypothetical protein [Isosphaeraceae bacterium]
MARFRVPYPTDPERRQALFERAIAKLQALSRGTFQGTPDVGSFQGWTPIGSFAGSYYSPPGSGEIEITLIKKPFLIPLALIESEARRFVATA